jgi:hypothetical protein
MIPSETSDVNPASNKLARVDAFSDEVDVTS